ncbi:MAG: capsule assembly Wzi family protein [Muribaculaceae bacterium]|nr:capsule assembly Wzi family protein [Muribaculaceae bacterium]
MIYTVDSAIRRLILIALLLTGSVINALADINVEYGASVTAQLSSSSLAPYMLGSWNEGRYAEGSGIWQEAWAEKHLDMDRRFSWSAGIGYLAGAGSKTYYDRWDEETGTWGTSGARRNAFRITSLYGELKYRQVFLTLGIKEGISKIVDGRLSSGDLTRSNNASPIPGIATGFLDFQDIPFTNGWVQINGEIMYGRMMDSGFKKREFNQYSGIEAADLYYNYKYCYFRTNPDKDFHVTVGMQAAALFGGTTYTYRSGKLVETTRRGFKPKDLLQAFFPMEGGESYYEGSHLGSWDLKATYRFREGSKLHAYFEWPWEDGSGIGRMNGWDGLWGLQYDFARRGAVTKAVVEYLDFTNQSGPIHFDQEDNPGNPLTGVAQGGDNYYNNDYYGAYTNYGMSIGTPFLLAPIYNRNGMLDYLHNRARGFHVAVEGNPTERLGYRVMVGYSVAGGAGRIPDFQKSHSTSGMVEARWQPSVRMPGLELSMKMAIDRGSLRGDNFGVQLQVGYRGDFNLKKR